MSHRVIVFGDSHIHALRAAIRRRKGAQGPIAIEVYLRLKDSPMPAAPAWRRIGDRLRGLVRRPAHESPPSDLPMSEFLKVARQLTPDDVLVSAIGGNLHAVFSTVQHPLPFDFLVPPEGKADAEQGAELIPFRTLNAYFVANLREGDGQKIAELRNATRARMIHLQAPPPKQDNDYIERHHDTQFAQRGLTHHGVSDPALRMKFWRLQRDAIQEICGQLGVESLDPPGEACGADGFLDPNYYAGDATHANRAYGELVLRQLEQRFGEAQAS